MPKSPGQIPDFLNILHTWLFLTKCDDFSPILVLPGDAGFVDLGRLKNYSTQYKLKVCIIKFV